MKALPTDVQMYIDNGSKKVVTMRTYVKESRVNFDVELMSKMILHISPTVVFLIHTPTTPMEFYYKNWWNIVF